METAQKQWRKGSVISVAFILLALIGLLAVWQAGKKRPVEVLGVEISDGTSVNLIVASCNEDPEVSSIETVGDVARIEVVANTGNNEECEDALPIELDAEVSLVFDLRSRSSFFLEEAENGKWGVSILNASIGEGGVVFLDVASCDGEPELGSIDVDGEVATVRIISDQSGMDACGDSFGIDVDADISRIVDAVSGDEFTIRS